MEVTVTPAAPKGQYTYIVPVSGVTLGGSLKETLQLVRVTLYSTERFMRLRSLGCRHTPKQMLAGAVLPKTVSAFAVMPVFGQPEQDRRVWFSDLRRELYIAAACGLGISRRSRPCIVGPAGLTDDFMYHDFISGRGSDWGGSQSAAVTRFNDLIIDTQFLGPKMHHFFLPLLKIIHSKNTSNQWRDFLVSVAITLGRSQNSISTSDAFLWNMIALEQILGTANDGNKARNVLLHRSESLIGHCKMWHKLEFPQLIERLYKARCQLVHEGDMKAITPSHVRDADWLLLQLISAIVRNSRFFSSKQSIIDHCNAVQHRAGLKMAPMPKQWKTLFYMPHYSDDDIREHWPL